MPNTQRHKGNVLVSLLIVLLLVLLVFVLAFPSLKEWWHSRSEGGGETENATIPAELIGTDTLQLTPGVIATLNVRTVAVQKVQQGELLELTGSLAPDTDRLLPLRSRFAGEVVAIGDVHQGDPESVESVRPVTTGDKVAKGQVLAIVWSKDLGEKKSELVDAIARLNSHLEALNKLLEAARGGGIPDQTIREARSTVATDRIAITRAELTLRTFRLTDEEIAAFYKEAELIIERVRKGEHGQNKKQEANWARVEVRAPFEGTVLERNVAIGAIIDTTANLFMIGDLSKLHAFGYVYEEDLPVLLKMSPPIPWTVRLKSDPNAEPLHGYVKEVRPFLDPTMHTALLRGQVSNPKGRMISGQFITATIQLPPAADHVEVPTEALVEDGHSSIVFVKPEKEKARYTARQVQVVRRTREKIYIQSEPQAAARARGCQALLPGEPVVVGGALELWAALNEQKSEAEAAKSSIKSGGH